jgi:hypothetical protein
MLEVRRQVISTAHDAEPGITVFGDAGQVPVSLNQWGPIFTDAPQNEMPTGTSNILVGQWQTTFLASSAVSVLQEGRSFDARLVDMVAPVNDVSIKVDTGIVFVDVIMPSAPADWANLTTGAITEARLDDQVARVLLPYRSYGREFGQFDSPRSRCDAYPNH